MARYSRPLSQHQSSLPHAWRTKKTKAEKGCAEPACVSPQTCNTPHPCTYHSSISYSKAKKELLSNSLEINWHNVMEQLSESGSIFGEHGLVTFWIRDPSSDWLWWGWVRIESWERSKTKLVSNRWLHVREILIGRWTKAKYEKTKGFLIALRIVRPK